MRPTQYSLITAAFCLNFQSVKLSNLATCESTAFSRDNFRPEVALAGDIIFGLATDYVSLDVRVKFGESMSNRSRIIRRTHFVMDNDERTTGKSRNRQDFNEGRQEAFRIEFIVILRSV